MGRNLGTLTLSSSSVVIYSAESGRRKRNVTNSIQQKGTELSVKSVGFSLQNEQNISPTSLYFHCTNLPLAPKLFGKFSPNSILGRK